MINFKEITYLHDLTHDLEDTKIYLSQLKTENIEFLAYVNDVLDLVVSGKEPLVTHPKYFSDQVRELQQYLNDLLSQKNAHAEEISRAKEKLQFAVIHQKANDFSMKQIRDFYLNANSHIDSKKIEGFSDEEILNIFMSQFNSVYSELYEALLVGEHELIDRKILILLELMDVIDVDVSSPDNLIRDRIKEALLDLKNWKNHYCLPQVSNNVSHFFSLMESESLDIVDNQVIIFIPDLKCFGMKVIKSGVICVRIAFNDKRKTASSTGLGIYRPIILDLENVIASVVKFDFYGGTYKDLELSAQFYDMIFFHYRNQGKKSVKTHSFDPTYILDSITSGTFSVPHLNGFQVEDVSLENSNTTIKYVDKERPYFFFVFDSEKLESMYPTSDPENIMNHYHFIKGGLNISSSAFLNCVVSPEFKRSILRYFSQIGESETKKILGDKKPEDFFISHDYYHEK